MRPNCTEPMIVPTSVFFQPSTEPKLISDEILKNLVMDVCNTIEHVPNKNIGDANLSLTKFRSLVIDNSHNFPDFYFASAYLSLRYKIAQCAEFSDILYTLLGEGLPDGTKIERLNILFDDDSHGYIKVELPKDYAWQDRSRVRFCDAWYKKYTTTTSGVYHPEKMDLILEEIGKGCKQPQITHKACKKIQKETSQNADSVTKSLLASLKSFLTKVKKTEDVIKKVEPKTKTINLLKINKRINYAPLNLFQNNFSIYSHDLWDMRLWDDEPSLPQDVNYKQQASKGL